MFRTEMLHLLSSEIYCWVSWGSISTTTGILLWDRSEWHVNSRLRGKKNTPPFIVIFLVYSGCTRFPCSLAPVFVSGALESWIFLLFFTIIALSTVKDGYPFTRRIPYLHMACLLSFLSIFVDIHLRAIHIWCINCKYRIIETELQWGIPKHYLKLEAVLDQPVCCKTQIKSTFLRVRVSSSVGGPISI